MIIKGMMILNKVYKIYRAKNNQILTNLNNSKKDQLVQNLKIHLIFKIKNKIKIIINNKNHHMNLIMMKMILIKDNKNQMK
jgi:hypothetical protein